MANQRNLLKPWFLFIKTSFPMTIVLLLYVATFSSFKATDSELETETHTVKILNTRCAVVSAGPKAPGLTTLGGLFTLQQPLRDGVPHGDLTGTAQHPGQACTHYGIARSSPS